MTIAQTLLPQFDFEMTSTRTILARIPEADAAWRPHPKSFSLGDLAAHIGRLPVWGRVTMGQPELDLGAPANAALARSEFTTTASLVEAFDRDVAECRAAIAAVSDAAMAEPWTLRAGERVVFTMPRIGVYRGFVLSHLIHHRGQLSVYLRLRDVPLPSLYGPTADSPR